MPMNEAMSDVDAIRTLARERDLEFVDLDAQTVDNSTAEVLPEAIALRLHVVAIKWESGIPVIAVPNPDDIFVLDTIRASVGRDFTLVVAPPEQIVRYVDRLYDASHSSGPAAPTGPVPGNPEPVSRLGTPDRYPCSRRWVGIPIVRIGISPERGFAKPRASNQWTWSPVDS